MKTFVKVIGIVMYTIVCGALFIAGMATLQTVREHSDAILELMDRVEYLENHRIKVVRKN